MKPIMARLRRLEVRLEWSRKPRNKFCGEGRPQRPGCWGRSRVLRRITSPVAESMATISNIGGSLAGARGLRGVGVVE
jgi:hypothetical protein